MVETFYKSIVFSVVNNKHLSKDKKEVFLCLWSANIFSNLIISHLCDKD